MTEQYTHTELLFAKELRVMAYKLRRQETPDHLLDRDDALTRRELAEWEEAHPMDGYYRRCLEAVTESADIIRELLKP